MNRFESLVIGVVSACIILVITYALPYQLQQIPEAAYPKMLFFTWVLFDCGAILFAVKMIILSTLSRPRQ